MAQAIESMNRRGFVRAISVAATGFAAGHSLRGQVAGHHTIKLGYDSQSAELDGKVLNRPWFEHADIVNGGSLFLHMGARPNTAWGSAPEAAPPSMSSEQPSGSN